MDRTSKTKKEKKTRARREEEGTVSCWLWLAQETEGGRIGSQEGNRIRYLLFSLLSSSLDGLFVILVRVSRELPFFPNESKHLSLVSSVGVAIILVLPLPLPCQPKIATLLIDCFYCQYLKNPTNSAAVMRCERHPPPSNPIHLARDVM